MPGGHPGDAMLHRLCHALEDRFHICHATIQTETGEVACHLAAPERV